MLFWNKTPNKIAELQAKLTEAQEQRFLAESLLEAVNNSTHLGIWMAYYTAAGEMNRVVYSDEFRRMLGYTRTEFPDDIQVLGTLIHPDEVQNVFAAYGAAAADKTNLTKFDIDYRLLTKKGLYQWFHAAGECLRWPDGAPRVFVGTFTDIDEKRKLSEAMETSRRRQNAVDLMMLEGTWSMDLTKYKIDDANAPMVFSEQFRRVLGYSGERDFPSLAQSWISRIHPDDVAGAAAAMAKQLADPAAPPVVNTEYRMMHRDGQYRWVRSSSTVVWSADRRQALMAAGIIEDITEQKRNELQFRNEMEPKIQSLRDGIAHVAASIRLAVEQMRGMAAKQREVGQSAKKIEASVDSSMKIVSSIKYIADQTRLLSVNAYIEAARAGEVGRSFSAVASEVQSLSNSTKGTTDNIADILTEMNVSVKDALEKIAHISENVTSENQKMEAIDREIEKLSVFADEIGGMISTLFQS